MLSDVGFLLPLCKFQSFVVHLDVQHGFVGTPFDRLPVSVITFSPVCRHVAVSVSLKSSSHVVLYELVRVLVVVEFRDVKANVNTDNSDVRISMCQDEFSQLVDWIGLVTHSVV